MRYENKHKNLFSESLYLFAAAVTIGVVLLAGCKKDAENTPLLFLDNAYRARFTAAK